MKVFNGILWRANFKVSHVWLRHINKMIINRHRCCSGKKPNSKKSMRKWILDMIFPFWIANIFNKIGAYGIDEPINANDH